MTTLRPKDRDLAFVSRITRRGLLLGAGAVGIESRIGVAQTPATKVDHTIRIAPASLEIAPDKIIKTTGTTERFRDPRYACKRANRLRSTSSTTPAIPISSIGMGSITPPM